MAVRERKGFPAEETVDKGVVRRVVIPAGFFLAGLAACLALLEIALRIASGLYIHTVVEKIAPGADAGSPVVVACFGDSFTEGGNAEAVERYPAQLQKMFDAAKEKACVINYGICEANTVQVRRRLFEVAKSRHVDYAVVLAGASNRFNLIGFDDGAVPNFLKRSRIYRLAHMFRIYVADRVTRLEARHFDFEAHLDAKMPTDVEIGRLVEQDPGKRYLWAQFYMSQARYKEALDVLRREMTGDNTDPDILILAGKCCEKLKDYPAAERLFDAAAEASPGKGYLALGRYYTRRNDFGTAERMFRTAVRHDPLQGYIGLGLFFNRMKKFDRAEDAFKQAALINRREGDAQLVDLYARNGRYAEAEEKYVAALAREKDPNLLCAFAGRYYVPRGKYADAVRCLLTALDQETPPSIFPLFLLAQVYKLQSEYTAHDILAVMDRAAARNPFLEREPAFRTYREYFRNAGGWYDRMCRWVTNDLDEMAAFCREKGIVLIILNYPDPRHPVNALLFEFARSRGLPFVDLGASFGALIGREGKDRYFRKDSMHCTNEGNRVMAEGVFGAVRSLRTPPDK